MYYRGSRDECTFGLLIPKSANYDNVKHEKLKLYFNCFEKANKEKYQTI